MHLETLLKTYGQKPSLVNTAMDLLEPLYERGGRRYFALDPRSEVLAEKAMKAIAGATTEPVTKVIMVPVDRPIETPDWLTAAAVKKMTDQAFLEMTGGSRSQWMLGSRIEVRRPSIISKEMTGKLQDRLGMSLWDSLGYGIDRYLKTTFGPGTIEAVSTGMRLTVLCYLKHVVYGDQTQAQAIAPVIALYPRIIPLFEHQERRGVWIALVNN